MASLPAVSASAPVRLGWMSAAIAAGAALALLGGGYLAARVTAPASLDLSTLEMVPLAVEPVAESSATLSPDGHSVAYVRSSGSLYEIVVKSDNAPAPAVLSRGHSDSTGDLFWSPDGARIYFLEGSRLRSVATVGGEARDELRDINGAAVAPDGKSFAAIRINTIGAFGPAKDNVAQLFVGVPDRWQLYEPPPVSVPFNCSTNYVRYSPDGSKILLWLACDKPGILILPAPDAEGRGGRARRLWETEVRTPQGIAWLSDSRHVVLSRSEFHAPGSIWLGDTANGALTHVTEALVPIWDLAADRHNTISFTEGLVDNEVVELPLAGGTPRTLVQSTRSDAGPAWSPVGQTLAYVAKRPDGDEVRVRSGSLQSETRLLTPRDFPEPRPHGFAALAFSPDGQRLALTAYAAAPAISSGVWVIPATGGTPRRVSQPDVLAVRGTWAPDGRTLAILQGKAGAELWVTDIGESSARQVPIPADLVPDSIEWSPNANVIAAFELRADAGPRPIILIDPFTGAIRRLSSVEWSVLAWSRDGKQLYGLTALTNGAALQTLDVATATLRTVAGYDTQVHVGENFGQSRRLTWAPDGRSLVTTVFIDRSNVWLMKGLQLPRRNWWPFARMR
jgi:dipeptidyl aminopeptidase/acylaminoacyl peptidase